MFSIFKKKHRPPSILFVSHSSSRNGAPLALYRLIKSSGIKYPMYVIFPSAGPVVSLFDKAGCYTIILNTGDEFTQYKAHDAGKINKIIKKIKPSVVFANSIGSYLAVYAAKKARRPSILHIHEILDPGTDKKRRNKWLKSFRLSKKTYCVSDASLKSVLSLSPGTTPSLLVPGIDTDAFEGNQGTSNNLQKKLNIPTGSSIICTIGTVCPNKGTEYFFEAAKMLYGRFTNAYFLVIGKIRDKYKQYYNDLAKLSDQYGIGDRFFFLGERLDIPYILSETDIFVQPSLFEAFSLVNMEAMAAGVPVIATRVGGNPEQILTPHAGILIPPKDPIALANAIKHLLDDPEQRRFFGQNGRKHAQKHFDIRQNSSIFKEAIESLINTRY